MALQIVVPPRVRSKSEIFIICAVGQRSDVRSPIYVRKAHPFSTPGWKRHVKAPANKMPHWTAQRLGPKSGVSVLMPGFRCESCYCDGHNGASRTRDEPF